MRLDDGNDLVADAWAPLSRTELERAGRFVDDRARGEYVRTRAALRRLIGAYLGCTAADVALERTSLGKPYVVGGRPLEINVSHSWPFAAIALSTRTPVGVDVELRSRAQEVQRVVERMASPNELAALRSCLDDELALRIWTRKEAVLKAEGTGLDARLSRLDTTPVVVRAIGGSTWRLLDLEASGVVGAIAHRDSAGVEVVYLGGARIPSATAGEPRSAGGLLSRR